MSIKPKKNKGGRPRQEITRDERISVRCSLLEKKIIESKAQKANLTKSEFLRESGLNIKLNIKTIPKEILQYRAEMNHLAANINQLAKMANINNYLDSMDVIDMKELIYDLKQIAENLTKKR